MSLIWVTQAKYVKDYQIELTFNDGLSGVVDLEPHLDGSVFKPLKVKDYFKNFVLDTWTLTWPNESDFAPEFLYELALKEIESASVRP